jgi:K+-transporting ATPase c subunit
LGSGLIGQQFDDPRYFRQRLSANASFPYNAARLVGNEFRIM